jgi:hypothetical protein
MKKHLCRVSGSRQRGTCAESRSTWLSAKNYWAVAKRPSTSTRTGRIRPTISPAVAGRRSADQRLTAPSSPQTLVYMRPSLSCPPPPPTDAAASLCPPRLPPPPPPARATPPAQPRHRHGPLRRHSRVAPLLPPPLAPHLVARSNGGARSGGGRSGPPARPPSRRDFLAASRCGSGGWCGGLLPAQIRWWCGGLPPGVDPVVRRPPPGADPVVVRRPPSGAPSLSLSASFSLCVWWSRVVAAAGVVAVAGGAGGCGWWQCRWRW